VAVATSCRSGLRRICRQAALHDPRRRQARWLADQRDVRRGRCRGQLHRAGGPESPDSRDRCGRSAPAATLCGEVPCRPVVRAWPARIAGCTTDGRGDKPRWRFRVRRRHRQGRDIPRPDAAAPRCAAPCRGGELDSVAARQGRALNFWLVVRPCRVESDPGTCLPSLSPWRAVRRGAVKTSSSTAAFVPPEDQLRAVRPEEVPCGSGLPPRGLPTESCSTAGRVAAVVPQPAAARRDRPWCCARGEP